MTSNLTIRQLEVFAMASRSPTFSEAAKRLGITQPSLSNTIAKIEEQLGISLFDRTTRRLALTAAGEQLSVAADNLVQQFHVLMGDVGRNAAHHSGRLSMAILPSVATSIGAKAMASFSKANPDFVVTLHDMSQEKALAWVSERIVDFGIIAETALPSDLVSEPMYMDEFQVICRKDSPLADRKTVSARDFASVPLILTGSAPIRKDIESAWSKANWHIKPRFEVEQIMTGLALVSEGLGATILPSLYLPTALNRGLISRRLADLRLHRQISFVRRSDKVLTKGAEQMVECLRQSFREFQGLTSDRRAKK